MPKKYNNKKGFTLIELLVVVIIVGILASILVPTYQKYILKSRAAEALNLLEMVKTRQQVALAKSPTKTYIPNAAELAPLTAGSTEMAQGVDLLVNTDYTVTLNSSSQCAVVIYKQGTADEFKFAASYERPGVACVGSICNSFTTVTTNDIDSVCVLETAQPVAPPSGPVCNRTCPAFAPLNADICGCICTNTGTLMDESTQSCPEPSCQDDFTGCLGDKVLTPIPTNLCNCACPPTKPIEGENNTCLDCNDACPTSMSFIWSVQRRRCETTCPEGTILDDSNPSNPQCVSCAQATGGAQPFWVANSTITPSEDTSLCVVSNGGHCEPCPEDKPIWDGETCISCEELHAYAISIRTQGTGGVTSGTTTGYTYTEIAAYQIKEQATSASPKSGGTKSGEKSGESKTLEEDFDNAEAALDAAKKALEIVKTEISTSEFDNVKKELDAAAAELKVAKKDKDADKAKAALDTAMKALGNTKSTAVVNAAKTDLNSAKSGFDASAATSATANTNYTQATAAGVKSPSSGSSNSVYDALVTQYGSGPYWYEGMCKYCYEIPEFADTPVYDEERDECVSCIEKYPARVKCSGANSSSNTSGTGGGNSSYYGGHEYMQMGVSLPTRFNDYMADFRADLDKYAFDSGALLANYVGAGMTDNLGRELSLQEINQLIQGCNGCLCGMSSGCNSCYGNHTFSNTSFTKCETIYDVGNRVGADCSYCDMNVANVPVTDDNINNCGGAGQYMPAGAVGTCKCTRRSGNQVGWDCNATGHYGGGGSAHGGIEIAPPTCMPSVNGVGSTSVVTISSDYFCDISSWDVPSGTSGTAPNYGTQGSCEDTWHGATEYVPAKPIWNSTTHQCEACLPATATCNSTGTETPYLISSGTYWAGGNTCVSINSPTSHIGSYQTPTCYHTNSGTRYFKLYCHTTGALGCKGTLYYRNPFEMKEDDGVGGYCGNNTPSCQQGVTCPNCYNSNIEQQVKDLLGMLAPQELSGVTVYGPKDKGFYAITRLGLAPVESIYNHSGYVIVE